jgi:rRNA maturation endonuclease Nob1
MALKYQVEKLEDVEEAQRALYVEDKDGGGFRLAVEGLDDGTELKRAKQHEVEARKAAEKRVKELEAKEREAAEAARKAAEEAAKKSGDIAALEKSWSEKLAQQLAETEGKYKGELESLTGDINRLLIDNVAQGLANQLAVPGSADVLMPHIKARLKTDIRDGKRTTIVVDAEGKPSAMTLADLAKEISGNKAFAPIVAGSKASGGGAAGGKGGGATDTKTISRADFEAMDPRARAAHFKAGGKVVDATT